MNKINMSESEILSRKRKREDDETKATPSKRIKLQQASDQKIDSNHALHLKQIPYDEKYIFSVNIDKVIKYYDIRFLFHMFRFTEKQVLKTIYGNYVNFMYDQIQKKWNQVNPYTCLKVLNSAFGSPFSLFNGVSAGVDKFRLRVPRSIYDYFNNQVESHVHYYAFFNNKYYHFFLNKRVNLQSSSVEYSSINDKNFWIKNVMIPSHPYIRRVDYDNFPFAWVQDYHFLNPKSCVCVVGISPNEKVELEKSVVQHLESIYDTTESDNLPLVPIQLKYMESNSSFIQCNQVLLPPLFHMVINVKKEWFSQIQKDKETRRKWVSELENKLKLYGVANSKQYIELKNGIVQIDTVYGFVIPSLKDISQTISIQPCSAVSISGNNLSVGFNLSIQPSDHLGLEFNNGLAVKTEETEWARMKTLIHVEPHSEVEKMIPNHILLKSIAEFQALATQMVSQTPTLTVSSQQPQSQQQ